MCSCLLAFMEENFQGDLSDIVRAGGGGMAAADDDYYIFSEQFQPSDSNGFGDPFSSMRDPFLVELDGIDHPSFSACGNFEESLIGTTPFQISAASDKYNSNCNSSMNHEMVSASAFQPLPTYDLQGVSCDNGVMNHSLSPKPPPSTDRLQMCSPRNPITKRRKSQVKKVVCIPAANSRQGGGEVVPSDLWAWRKYGQKPIKGSPYPRGYYRCSSSKGCPARKQVERSRTDPNMLVITYTSEHNHPWPTQRNSLAGSTRIPFKPGSHKAVYMKEEVDPDKVEETGNGDGDDRKGLNDVVSDDQLMVSQIPSDYSDSFAELRDLEGDFFTQSMLDPYSSLFDWTSNSSATSTTNRSKHEEH